jgi:catechol 2,3-dioxygenase-like lactoylglutathione lyase family enzyme
MSAGIVGLDHVQVAAPTASEESARRFYGGTLGLEEIEKPVALAVRGGVWFRVGRQELHVGVVETFAPARKAHPAFEVGSVAELERLAEAVAAHGVEVTWPDPGEIPATTRFFCHDPWGNRLELVTRAAV